MLLTPQAAVLGYPQEESVRSPCPASCRSHTESFLTAMRTSAVGSAHTLDPTGRNVTGLARSCRTLGP